MSKTFKIKGIEKEFCIKAGEIYNINIENSNFYYRLLNDLINKNDETFIFSVDHEIFPFDKNCLIINDLFNIDLNNKRILTSLYKRISEHFLTNEDNRTLLEINEKTMTLLEKISMDLNLPVDYETELDMIKLLNLYKFCFKDEFNTPIEKVVSYIKANLEVSKFTFVIAINTLPLFNIAEMELLSRELAYLDLSLINISFIQKSFSKIVQSITIDDDLCEF